LESQSSRCKKENQNIADVSDSAVCALLAQRTDVPMKKTILLVEDSKVQKRAIEKILIGANYLVLFAGDGEEALLLARECGPDLVLLDLLLPKIGGEEVLYSLKRNPHTEPIPVIVISHLAAGQSAELKILGAADCFEKSEFLERNDGDSALLKLIERVFRDCDGRTGMAKHASIS
jgi:CheY-like chemotaxis protein